MNYKKFTISVVAVVTTLSFGVVKPMFSSSDSEDISNVTLPESKFFKPDFDKLDDLHFFENKDHLKKMCSQHQKIVTHQGLSNTQNVAKSLHSLANWVLPIIAYGSFANSLHKRNSKKSYIVSGIATIAAGLYKWKFNPQLNEIVNKWDKKKTKEGQEKQYAFSKSFAKIKIKPETNSIDNIGNIFKSYSLLNYFQTYVDLKENGYQNFDDIISEDYTWKKEEIYLHVLNLYEKYTENMKKKESSENPKTLHDVIQKEENGNQELKSCSLNNIISSYYDKGARYKIENLKEESLKN